MGRPQEGEARTLQGNKALGPSGTCLPIENYLPGVDENPEGPGGGENLLQGQPKDQHSLLQSQTDVLYPGMFAHEIQTVLGVSGFIHIKISALAVPPTTNP